MFYVGQKVVCVDAGPFYTNGVPTPLVKGSVYTVVGLGRDDETLVLAEQPGRNDMGWNSALGYRAERFRPIVERKTDISIFTDMLKPKSVEVSA